MTYYNFTTLPEHKEKQADLMVLMSREKAIECLERIASQIRNTDPKLEVVLRFYNGKMNQAE